MPAKLNVVTGATGLLGSHLVEQLVARGEHVRALVRPASDVTFLRQCGVELAHRLRGNACEISSEVGKPIDGQHADPAAIGEDGEPLAWKRLHPS